MITVIVTYQVKPEYAAKNKENIATFLEDFKKLDTSAFQYNVYTKEDGISFVHYSTYRNEAVQTEVLNVPSFKEFQRQRDESGLNNSHKVEVLTYVGSANDIVK
jgi:quinol monooxygenase YgiN